GGAGAANDGGARRMTQGAAHAVLDAERAERYFAGELSADEETELEDHAMSCAACSAELAVLADMIERLRMRAREGDVISVIGSPLLERMRAVGVRLQEVELRGADFHARVPADTDVLVARVSGDFRGVRRVDVEFSRPDGGGV